MRLAVFRSLISRAALTEWKRTNKRLHECPGLWRTGIEAATSTLITAGETQISKKKRLLQSIQGNWDGWQRTSCWRRRSGRQVKRKGNMVSCCPRVRAMITKLSALNFDRDVEGTNQVSKLKTWSSQVLKQIKMKAPQGGWKQMILFTPTLLSAKSCSWKMADKTNVAISPARLWSGFLAEVVIIYSKKERSDQVQISIGTLA